MHEHFLIWTKGRLGTRPIDLCFRFETGASSETVPPSASISFAMHCYFSSLFFFLSFGLALGLSSSLLMLRLYGRSGRGCRPRRSPPVENFVRLASSATSCIPNGRFEPLFFFPFFMGRSFIPVVFLSIKSFVAFNFNTLKTWKTWNFYDLLVKVRR